MRERPEKSPEEAARIGRRALGRPTGRSRAPQAWLWVAMAASVPALGVRDFSLLEPRDRPRSRAPRSACEGRRAELPETLSFRLRGGAFPGSNGPDVAVHVPRGFDATRRPGLLIYFHGWQGCVGAAMTGEDTRCRQNGERRRGSAIAEQMDRAHVNALAVAIELRAGMRTGEPGNLATPGGLHELLRELLGEKLAPYVGCPIDVDALDRVVVVAHSGGYQAAASVLALGDVPQIREVVLLDALYGAREVFLRWMADETAEESGSVPPPRRLVDLYTCCGGTAEASRSMARAVGEQPSSSTLAGQPNSIRAAGTRRWLFEEVTDAHGDLPRAYVGVAAEAAGFSTLGAP